MELYFKSKRKYTNEFVLQLKEEENLNENNFINFYINLFFCKFWNSVNTNTLILSSPNK